MSILEKQSTLGKSLFEINNSTVKELISLQRDNIQQYFDTNRDFGSRITEVTGITDFVGLQREYGQTLWNNAKGAVEAQNEIVKDAFMSSRDAVKTAFTAEEAAEEAAAEVVAETTEAVKPKAKAKAKAKKPAAEAA